MKTKQNLIKTLTVLLSLGIGLSGCFASSGEKMMMDNSMSSPIESMDKGTMNETMPASKGMAESGSMGSEMMNPMK